ncbi:AcrZ family multidrug efflux pump-associated protein [Salmonella enterica subsp. enterica]|nr:AcrZ family multidrug efflux pump-associated protein [Salmonella enterica subsp. enterica]
MVPVVMAIILGLIYGLNLRCSTFFSGIGQKTGQTGTLISPNARSVGRFVIKIAAFSCRYFLCLIVNGYNERPTAGRQGIVILSFT